MTARPKLLAAVHPNAGVEAEFRRSLRRLIDAMNASVVYWVERSYRCNEPKAANDELPAKAMQRTLRKLARRWQVIFDRKAPALAAYFANQASDRTDAQLRAALRKSGITVRFKMTAAQRDIVAATIAQNVSLIRSIPQQYLKDVEGSVMRSVQVGHDLGKLTAELQKNYGVAYRRAAFIARDQNNKASAAHRRTRKLELGIVQDVWMHSGGGKHARPSHLKAGRDRVRFSVAKGWYDPHEKKWIQPGELPNCRCVSKAVLPSTL